MPASCPGQFWCGPTRSCSEDAARKPRILASEAYTLLIRDVPATIDDLHLADEVAFGGVGEELRSESCSAIYRSG